MNSYPDSHESNKPSKMKQAVAGAMLASSLFAGQVAADWNKLAANTATESASDQAEAVMTLTLFFSRARELRDATPPNQRAEFVKKYLEAVALAKQYGIDYKKLESGK